MYCKSNSKACYFRAQNGINSSKVYCKFLLKFITSSLNSVLIVAKCIVNVFPLNLIEGNIIVLIVAKCIVNKGFWYNVRKHFVY